MDQDTPIGHAALITSMDLRCPPPAVWSRVGPGARQSRQEDGRTVEKYPASYAPADTFIGHLRFALRYEPLDLGVMAAAFQRVDPQVIEDWVRREPSGTYSRRAWFLYEWLTGRDLDLEDAGAVPYADALSSDLHVVARGIRSRRHKVVDNLLGVPGYCPTVRRTPELDTYRQRSIAVEARRLVEGCHPDILARAVNYLYTKETRSSYEIEHETATAKRAERFVMALRSAGVFDPTDSASLTALQNVIVEPRYAARGFRDFQNFVGETAGGYREIVHFICPRPDDVADLMTGWAQMTERLKGATDPVTAAALVAFGFVFLHPYDDGNGRMHRFLIHHVLAAEGFTPPNVLFPVSAAILRDRRGYDAALETFSKAIAPYVDWEWTTGKFQREMRVTNDTAHLYRYFDATPLVEFLYAKISETIEKDLKEELAFVTVYDAALMAVRERIDMPDRRASLFVRLCLQNGGVLSKRKRAEFDELSDEELTELEEAIQAVMGTVSLNLTSSPP